VCARPYRTARPDPLPFFLPHPSFARMRSCRAPTRCCHSSSCSPPLQSSLIQFNLTSMTSDPLQPPECATQRQISPIHRCFLPRSVSAKRFTKFLQSMNYSPPSCSLGDAGAGRGCRRSPERLIAVETPPRHPPSPPPRRPTVMVSSRLPDHV
jgi:hypothetical protein